MSKTFFNITKQECLQSYNEMLDNSDRHFRIAEQLAGNNEYGTAISHLVLGSEELVKSLIIFLDGTGLNLRQVAGVKKFFTDHKSRHFIAAMFIIMVTVIRPLLEMVERFKELLHVPESRKNMNELEKAIMQKDSSTADRIAKNWMETSGREMVEKIIDQLDFWLDADNYKMKGFYVDYKFELTSPKQISKDEFKLAFETTNNFRTECLRLIKYVIALPEKEKKELVKTINKDKNFYNMINDVIKGLKPDDLPKFKKK